MAKTFNCSCYQCGHHWQHDSQKLYKDSGATCPSCGLWLPIADDAKDRVKFVSSVDKAGGGPIISGKDFIDALNAKPKLEEHELNKNLPLNGSKDTCIGCGIALSDVLVETRHRPDASTWCKEGYHSYNCYCEHKKTDGLIEQKSTTQLKEETHGDKVRIDMTTEKSKYKCHTCGSCWDTNYCPKCAQTINDETNSDGSTGPSDGLFSNGFFGLLEKGPLGLILFGAIGGILYGAYQSLMSWLGAE